MNNPPNDRVLPFSTEELLARVVQKVGGSLVSDLLPPNGNRESNADYVFQQHKVIGELKRLVRDQDDNPDMAAKRNALYQKWIRERKRGVPIVYGRAVLDLRQLPSDCAMEMISLYREPIARRIRKANEQIKSTRKLLKLPEAIGVLFLAQDGDYSIGPEAVLNLAARCLKGTRFSGIDDVICFNALPARLAGESLGYMVWIHSSRDRNCAIPQALIDSLQEAWRAEMEAMTGPLVRPPTPVELAESRIPPTSSSTLEDRHSGASNEDSRKHCPMERGTTPRE